MRKQSVSSELMPIFVSDKEKFLKFDLKYPICRYDSCRCDSFHIFRRTIGIENRNAERWRVDSFGDASGALYTKGYSTTSAFGELDSDTTCS